jgi:polyisoprenyl-phosphate glycosyltransferase
MVDVPDISIVVPVYGSETTLMALYKRVVDAVNKIPASFELIFVDDCGPGDPWKIINYIAQKDKRVMGLRLSKNYGQHNAMTAGIDAASGKWIVVMDCDLQDRPEEIPRLWAKVQEGHDVVIGRRVERQDGFCIRFFSSAFHWIFRYVTGRKSDSTQSNFGIYSRNVVEKVKTLSEKPRIFPLLVRLAGFEIITIDVEHNKRAEGKSGYSFGRKISLAMDIICSYSDNLLHVFIRFILFSAAASLYIGFCIFICCFIFDFTPAGWISVKFSLYFFTVSLFFVIGFLGIYIGRFFFQVKAKQFYIVKDRTQMT